MAASSPSLLTNSSADDLIARQKSLVIDFQIPLDNSARSFQGKTLLVTGSASGLGEAFASAFARNPQTAVILADLDIAKGEKAAQTIRERGSHAKFIQTNVTDWDSVVSLFRKALTWLQTLSDTPRYIDHVICSAGVEGQVLDLSPVNPGEFLAGKSNPEPPKSTSIQVSVLGSMYTVAAATKFGLGLHLPDGEIGDKSITLVASTVGYAGMPLRSDYTASKWGVRGLWHSLLDDTKSATCPVRVNLLAPYFVATPLIASRVHILQKMGLKLAELQDVEAAAMRLMGDGRIHGRAVGVWEGGPVDLGDDFAGGFGLDALKAGMESGALFTHTAQVSHSRER